MMRFALITVSNKTGVEALAQGLEKLGYTVLSTANTAKYLRDKGCEVHEVSDVTGFPEILDGRVKTLHPVIHAGILADRDNSEHLRILEELKISPIDIVAVNLYPFEQTRNKPGVSQTEIIENIDIGGPALLRAAAKNFRNVLVLADPADYAPTLDLLQDQGSVPDAWRAKLAQKAFDLVSHYDALIADYLGGLDKNDKDRTDLPQTYDLHCKLVSPLRYGENPHQRAGYYTDRPQGWTVLHGKELSFNNLLDLDSSFRALRLFAQPTVVITKHCNPCGLACANDLNTAWRKAFATDPLSPYGGIVAVNRELDLSTAQQIDQIFTEIIIAPAYAEGVLDFLKKKKNRRLIRYEEGFLATPGSPWELKHLLCGYLVQEWDRVDENPAEWKVVTNRQPSPKELEALIFAWKVVSLLRSNAIAITTSDCTLGLGSGQTSRIDSTFLALHKASKFGLDLSQAVCASDGYFPFRDSVDELHRRGIKAIVQPGGSKADPEVIQACNELGMAMVFTSYRHFRH